MARTDLRPDPIAWAPRGLSRDEAARYVGVGTTKFDELVEKRKMPPARQIDGRKVWDRYALDAAFSELPTATASRLDGML